VIGNSILISSAYQRGAALIDFEGFQSKALWIKPRLVSNIASYVYENGLVYGTSNPAYGRDDLGAEFFCLDVSTGKKLWTTTKIRTGTVIAVDKYLVHLDQRGEVRIGLRRSTGFEAIRQCRVLNGECITPPVFSHGRLFCRNRMGRIVCIDLRK
jgi:outer membrane protein assembly factor BamB